MRTSSLIAGLGASMLMTAAWAQTGTTANNPTPPGNETFNATEFIGRRSPGVLRSSDFIGRSVYGPNNQVIGDVEGSFLQRPT